MKTITWPNRAAGTDSTFTVPDSFDEAADQRAFLYLMEGEDLYCKTTGKLAWLTQRYHESLVQRFSHP